MKKRTLLLQVCLLYFGISAFAQALSFTNSGYVNITNNVSLRLQNFTLEAWVKIEGSSIATGTTFGNEKGGGFKAGTVVPLITKGRSEKGSATTAVNYFFGYRLSDRKLVGDFEDNASGSHHPIVGNTVLPMNVWTHVAASYNTGTWKLYINGRLDKQLQIGSYIPQLLSNVTAAIASALNSKGAADGYLNGRMDEVRIWNVARSEADILANYNLALASGTGLMARYGFNEGSGITAINSISTATNGTLTNNPLWVSDFSHTPTPPTVSITSPGLNASFTEPASITVAAQALDDDGTISKVEFFSNTTLIGVATASPYIISWSNVAKGTYSLTAKATDNDGLTATSATVNVTVDATSNNQAPDVPINLSPSNNSTFSGNSVTLCVKAADADNTQVSVRFYGRRKESGRKFSLIMLPDTQYYTAEINGGTNAMFKSQTSWLANNIEAKNIIYAAQLGDCVENGDSYEVEWKRADTAMRNIENPTLTGLAEGIPYGICVGNHDQNPIGDVNGTTIYYNKYFGTSRFSGRSYYGGHMGTKNNNHYQFFSASGVDFLAISLEWNMTSSFTAAGGALDWAENLVKNNPSRKVILLSHAIVTGNMGTDAKFTFSSQGLSIYNRLKIYPNVLLLIGGHYSGSTGESLRSDTYNGYTIHSIMQDYQNRTKGGNGMLRIYEFDPSANKLAIQTYSPYTNTFETDANSQFTLDVNIAPSAENYALIGEVNNVTSGTNACVNWPLLQLNTDYEWYAEVYDGQSTTKGPVWSFLTRPVGTTTAPSKTSFSSESIVENSIQPLSSRLFEMYPNPNTNGHLTLRFKGAIRGKAIISIMNTSGQVQYQKEYTDPENNIYIDHHLPAGIYSVVVKTETSAEVKQLVIER